MGKTIKLLEHQIQALEYLKDIPKSCVFMKAGQGKTYIALEKFKDLDKILIVTTCKDFNNKRWEKEADTFGFKGDITVINYEKLRSKKTLQTHLIANYKGIIVDETHHFKGNYRTGATDSKHIRKLTKSIPNVIGLTGTPAPNNFIDTFNILQNLD